MDEKKQITINLYTNIIALLSNILVGIYYTPYLVNSLGLAAYGVLPLALIINQYIGVATQTLTHAYTRFYSVALQKGDYIEASKDISTSLVVVLLISLILVPIGIGIVFNVELLFQIPSSLLDSSRLLFGYTLISFVVSLISSLLNVTLYATNRLDLMNVLKIVRALFKLLFVILAFEIFTKDISYVGLANLLTESIIMVASICLFFRFKPSEVKISIGMFDRVVLFSILGMSIWVLVQLCGDTLLYRTDNLIVNHYWGTEASGALGAISEIGGYVSVVVSVIGSLFGPLILASFAKGEHSKVKSLFLEQSTIVGCLSAVLAGTISGCSNSILNTWIGNGMGQYSWWLVMKMVVLPYYAAGGILAFVYRAWNKMRYPAIATIILGVMDIIILVGICELFKPSDAMPILVVSAFFSIIQCFVLNIVVICKIYKDCRLKFIPIAFKITMSFWMCFVCGFAITSWLQINSLLMLGVLLISTAIMMFLMVSFVVFNKDERIKLLELVK